MASRVPKRRSLVTDLRWGLGWALGFATIYSLVVAGLVAARGSAPLERVGLTFGAIVRTYFVVALVVGALLGFLRPLASRRVGAMFVGAVCGTAVYAGVGIAMYGMGWETVMMGAFIGVPMGALLARSWFKKAEGDTPAAT